MKVLHWINKGLPAALHLTRNDPCRALDGLVAHDVETSSARMMKITTTAHLIRILICTLTMLLVVTVNAACIKATTPARVVSTYSDLKRHHQDELIGIANASDSSPREICVISS